MAKNPVDFVPVMKGRDLSGDDLRADFNGLDSGAGSLLDLQIVRLLALHPKLGVKFRSQDLSALDDTTKQALLKDMSDLLGIKPLKKSR
jgi:hypothetical protein